MSVAIIRFAGTNCEFDTRYAFESLGFEAHIIWHKDISLPNDTTLVVIPGGFSYGDYLRCGAIARYSPIMQAIKDFANNGGLVLGICNGFQILCEAHLLPGALKHNDNLRFISKLQSLKVCNTNNAFLSTYSKDSIIKLPIAHGEGHYYADDKTLATLEQNEQILLRYDDNPNGSVANIACICNEGRNVFGLMPHPERAFEFMEFANSSSAFGSDGRAMLSNLASARS